MVDPLATLLHRWWDLLLLVALPGLLSVLVTGFHQALRRRLDDVMQDDLPLSTGAWVRTQLDRLGIGETVRVVATPGEGGQIDAFLPDGALIQLSEETFFKRDPSFWAIGAHELGHALTYRRVPWLGGLLKAARGGSHLATSAGAAFLLANVLFGSRIVGDLALFLLGSGVLLTVLVLGDEAAASHRGHALLREGAAFTPRQRRAARLSMAAGFGTYLTSLLGRVLLLLATPGLVARMVELPAFVPGFPPTRVEATLLAFVSFLLLVAGGAELRRVIRPPRYASLEEAMRGESTAMLLRLVWELPLLYMMLQTWNHSREPGWIAVFLLAAIPAVATLARALALLLGVLLLPVFFALTPLFVVAARIVAPGGTAIEENPPRDPGARRELDRGRDEVGRIALEALNAPPFVQRLLQAQRVAFLPMVLYYWLA